MIAINWGSSNFRAFKLDAAGNVKAERLSGSGAVQLPPDGFLNAFMAELGDWVRGGETKVLMSGMVGARLGWKEAPYVATPATFSQVVDGVVKLEVISSTAASSPVSSARTSARFQRSCGEKKPRFSAAALSWRVIPTFAFPERIQNGCAWKARRLRHSQLR